MSAFELRVPLAQCNERFLLIREHPAHRCTRRLIDEILLRFTDKDGEFVKRFQTTEFEARLWELYLFSCLEEAFVTLDTIHNRPDFSCNSEGRSFFIEAATTNPPPNGASPSLDAEIEGDLRSAADLHMMRVMRAVCQKVAKDYPSLPWVNGKPIGIAVAPFHGPTSLHFTESSLQQYLWGIEPRFESEQTTAEQTRRLARVDRRTIAGREVEFGWFQHSESSSVGAILYSITATISKFHRMAVEKGYAEEDDFRLVHSGVAFDADPDAYSPMMFSYVVKPTLNGELWADGLSIIHNPRAQIPFPVGVFRSGMETLMIDGRLVNSRPSFHPYSSQTMVIIGKEAAICADRYCNYMRENLPDSFASVVDEAGLR